MRIHAHKYTLVAIIYPKPKIFTYMHINITHIYTYIHMYIYMHRPAETSSTRVHRKKN